MSSYAGKQLHRSPAVVSAGCGCHRPKLVHLLLWRWPKKPTTSNSSTRADPSYSWSPSESFTPTATPTTTTATSMSPTCSEAAGPSAQWPAIGSGRIKESVAVVKDSDDPYVDFRLSMLQMIVEKEIYAKEELRELLNCFLFLNSPDHHEIIIRAFMEIWNGAYSTPAARPEKEKKKKGR